jgi:hypothetical protein
LQGSIVAYYQTLEFMPGTVAGFATQSFSVVSVLGTGFAIPTTLITTLASCTSVDINALTGGQALLDRLVRVNNVSVLTTASRYTTQILFGQWTTSGTISLIDASIANVTTLSGTPYPGYSSLTIIPLEMTAGNVTAFNANPSQVAKFFAIVTAMPFNLVGVFDENNFPGPALNPMQYWILGRGESLGDDVTPYIVVSPASVSAQPGGPTVPFSATGGFPPYTWSLSNYAVGTIDSSGVFTPGATQGITNVIVTDSHGYPATVVGVVTNTATSAPLASDVSMAVPKVTDRMGITPYEFYER